MHPDFISSIGMAILGAALISIPLNLLKFPSQLSYLLSGIILGPSLGFGILTNPENISLLSEIGFIFLMFILGLEINLKKFKESGKSITVNGILQFLLCVLLGWIIFRNWPLKNTFGEYALYYVLVAGALSSTLVVIKILSDNLELETLPARITIGVLVFQDLWAITVMCLQPNIDNLSLTPLLLSIGKAIGLILFSLLISRFVLPKIFLKFGRRPEVMLVLPMAWCFGLSGLSYEMGLSKEMGALIAGVALASSPYHLDIANKISGPRDFFILLFFVGLGLQVPSPSEEVLALAIGISIFAVWGKFLTVFPVARLIGLGNRVSFLTALNLSQISEFTLVLATLGIKLGHVNGNLLHTFLWSMVITCFMSSFLIPKGDLIFKKISPILNAIGYPEKITLPENFQVEKRYSPLILILGLFREGSSILTEILEKYPEDMKKNILVVDFNPEVYHKLHKRGIPVLFGDIAQVLSQPDLNLQSTKVVITSLSDQRLKGIDNFKILQMIKKLAPTAKTIACADVIPNAINLYVKEADYVYMPRIIGAKKLVDVIDNFLGDEGSNVSTIELEMLKGRNEVVS